MNNERFYDFVKRAENNKKNILVITLGHNSSATIYTISENKKIKIIGYEEERFSKIKSDKSFPILSLNKIQEYVGDSFFDSYVIISHWFDDFEFYKKNTNKKYIQYYNFEYMKKFKNIFFLNKDFTHHDIHFISSYATTLETPKNGLVIDGFGNKQEVISIYKKGKLKHRVYGYDKSLGLMYQYATSFLEMKEKQDEYKLLGYESHIQEVLPQNEIDVLQNSFIDTTVNILLKKIFYNSKPVENNEFIDLNQLNETKANWYKTYNNVQKYFENYIKNITHKRIIIAFFVQQVLEKVVLKIINKFSLYELSISGGVFYNVKLNNIILKNVNRLKIMPVVGDQGVHFAVYKMLQKNLTSNFNLFLGKREINKEDIIKTNLKNVFYFEDKKEATDFIVNKLLDNKIVNLFTGDMEYGPRALCNTSTLALPLRSNFVYINQLNGRTPIMPMAPVVLGRNKRYFFNEDQTRKTQDDTHMIITFDYNNNDNKYSGVMHKYPLTNIYSGRPQIVYTQHLLIFNILEELEKLSDFKMLINTSFNYHGAPIVYSVNDALFNYAKQLENAENEDDICLVFVR